jgi:hypothetical protein
MHLAMLMVSMPVAIEVPAVGVPVHVAMMMAVPVAPVDIDILCRLHDPALELGGWPEWCSVGCCCGKCQGKASACH